MPKRKPKRKVVAPRQYLLTFKIKRAMHLGDNHERKKCQRALNLHYHGKELIPIGEPCSEELKAAHRQVCMASERSIFVDLYSDGSLVYRFS